MLQNKISDIAAIQLDPLLHSRVRLFAMLYLANTASISFAELAKHTHTTNGNLSIQLKKLETAGYITIQKGFTHSYPVTNCFITEKGKAALTEYRHNLYALLNWGL